MSPYFAPGIRPSSSHHNNRRTTLEGGSSAGRAVAGELIDNHCPACGRAGRPLPLLVDDRYRLVRCRTCRSEYFRRDPLRSPEASSTVSEYWEEYKLALYADPAVRREYERRYGAALASAQAIVGRISSVLDVGCGIGNFVAYAASRSMTAFGVDIDKDAVSTAQRAGLAVAHTDDLDQLLCGAGLVDALTLWDVIEHLYDPEPVVRQLAFKLQPGGAVILETPDAGFPLRSVLLTLYNVTGGRVDFTSSMYYWEHKIYFTEMGLRHLLARCNCDVVSVYRDTSPRAKMHGIFIHTAQDSNSVWSRAMAWLWPALERGVRRAQMGNKLIVVARHRQQR